MAFKLVLYSQHSYWPVLNGESHDLVDFKTILWRLGDFLENGGIEREIFVGLVQRPGWGGQVREKVGRMACLSMG